MTIRETEFSIKPVGIVHSIFKEKFGIPRQAGLVSEARAVIEIFPEYKREGLLKGLDGFSHIWVLFIFHDSTSRGWTSTVRPPRLGGKKRVGVFASRSPFRPNPIGMSALELEGIEEGKGKLLIRVKGADLLDGTPVIDIKPYLPYADAIADARGGYASKSPSSNLEVVFGEAALKACRERESAGHEELEDLIRGLLANDPRPGFYASKYGDARFNLNVSAFNVKWHVDGNRAIVDAIEDCLPPDMRPE